MILPDDEFNRELVASVRPPDWQNPEPAEHYNLVVIGAGPSARATIDAMRSRDIGIAVIDFNDRAVEPPMAATAVP